MKSNILVFTLIHRQSRERSFCLDSVSKFEGGLCLCVCICMYVYWGGWPHYFVNAQIKQLLKKRNLWLGHAPSSVLQGMVKTVNRALTSFLSWLYNSLQRGSVLLWKTRVRHWKRLIENEHQALNKQGRWWPFAPSAESPAHPVAKEQKKAGVHPGAAKSLPLDFSHTLFLKQFKWQHDFNSIREWEKSTIPGTKCSTVP